VAKAFIVTDGSVAHDDIVAFMKTQLSQHEYPRRIEFVAELPKTATGKIQRFRLREREAAQAR
jgi:benzoate-CoA ligase